jgi:nitrate/TMAO reductase-like tetraheme cytochrome c subunit
MTCPRIAKLMSLVPKLAVFAFLFLLSGLAVTWAGPASGANTAQLTQDQEKLCLSCHSPRDPPNDTTHVHSGVYALMDPGAPCWVCHGEGAAPGESEEPTRNPQNEYHPDEAETAAMGKDILDCGSCHYRHDILQELASGTVSPPSANATSGGSGLIAPKATVWAPMIGAGVSLITGVSMIAVLFSTRKHSTAKGGN